MAYDPHRHHRRSIRLKGYDYSQAGAYFVTICVQNGLCLWGDVLNGEMQLNRAGEMVEKAWIDLPERFPQVEMDVFQVMPNHFHAILIIQDTNNPVVGAGLVPALSEPTTKVVLGDMVGTFKSLTTHSYIEGVAKSGWPSFPGRLWQRNFYEHIIRNERALHAIREYIINNPAHWEADKLHPEVPLNHFNQLWRKSNPPPTERHSQSTLPPALSGRPAQSKRKNHEQ